MLSERYRRLWRRRLRRRPLVPLLLAATLAVDAAAAATDLNRWPPAAAGLVGAQVGLLALWVTHSWRGGLLRAALALGAALGLASVVTAAGEDPLDRVWTVFSASLALSVIAVGTTRRVLLRRGLRRRRRDRFSIGALLSATLLVAVVAAGARWFDWRLLADRVLFWRVVTEGAPPTAMIALASFAPGGWRRGLVLVGVPAFCLAHQQLQLSRGMIADEGVYLWATTLVIGMWLYLSRGGRAEPRLVGSPPKAERDKHEGPATLPMRFDVRV